MGLAITPDPLDRHFRYVARLQLCVVCALLLLLLAVHLWPPVDPKEPAIVTHTASHTVFIEEIIQSRQERTTPPPPAPLPPVVTPSEALLDEPLMLDMPFQVLEDPGEDPELIATGEPTAVFETTPKPFRIVEPEYPRAARRRRIQAEVVVEVFVDIHGNVSEPNIIERFLLQDGMRQSVAKLEYGLEEAALAAASRWQFRPATRGGDPVPSQHELSFRFGE